MTNRRNEGETKMKKWFISLLAVLLALPMFGSAVFAEEENDNSKGFEVKIDSFDLDGFGSFVSFFSKPAILTVENGEIYLEFSHSGIDHLVSVDTLNGVVVEILNEDNENDLRTYKVRVDDNLDGSFEFTSTLRYSPVPYSGTMTLDKEGVENFKEAINGEQPGSGTDENGGDGETTEPGTNENGGDEQTTEPGTDENGIDEEKSDSGIDENGTEEETSNSGTDEESSDPGTDENGTEDKVESDQKLRLNDGYYTIGASYLHSEQERPSAMASYLGESIFLSINDGKAEVTFTSYVRDNGLVTSMKVNGLEPIESKIDGDTHYYTFAIDDLSTLLNGFVEYEAHYLGMVMNSSANFRIVLNEESLQQADQSDKPGFEVKEEVDKEEKTANNDKTDRDTNKSDKIEIPTEADKVTTVNFTFYHEKENKRSAADGFFKNPAVIIEKNGEKYLQITSTNPEFINSLIAKFGDLRLEMKKIKENEDGSAIYELKLPSNYKLYDTILFDMVITVPFLPGYDNKEFEARLVFDESTVQEFKSVNEVDFETKISTVPLSSGGNNDLDENTPPKPDFGDSANGTSDIGKDQTKNTAGLNPKTGENTNIMLYVLLLIASAIPLAIKAKRHFA